MLEIRLPDDATVAVGGAERVSSAILLEPENAQASYELGAFYFEYKQWRPAYDALNNSYTYDRFGPASKTCGLLDQARAKAFNYSGTPARVLIPMRAAAQ